MDISRETQQKLKDAFASLANEMFDQHPGSQAVLITIHAGAQINGPLLFRMVTEMIGCQGHSHEPQRDPGAGDRREEPPYTGPLQAPAELVADLLRRLKRGRGN